MRLFSIMLGYHWFKRDVIFPILGMTEKGTFKIQGLDSLGVHREQTMFVIYLLFAMCMLACLRQDS